MDSDNRAVVVADRRETVVPEVSVIAACRNDGHYLGDFVDAMNGQLDVSLEVVLVDDGSAPPLGIDALAELKVPWVLLRTDGVGLAAAMNIAAGIAGSQLLARHDVDDSSSPKRLSLQRDLLRARGLHVVGSQASVTDEELRPLIRTRLPEEHREIATWLRRPSRPNPLIHGSVLMLREAFEGVGGYDVRFARSQDVDLWIRLVENGAMFANLPTAEYLWRARSGNSGASAGSLQGRFAQYAMSGPPQHRKGPVPSSANVDVPIRVRSATAVAIAAAGNYRGSIGAIACAYRLRESLRKGDLGDGLLSAIRSNAAVRLLRPVWWRLRR